MGLRMRVHDKEPIGQAMRRFKKLIERSGMQKELRAHQHYEKPCEQRRLRGPSQAEVGPQGTGRPLGHPLNRTPKRPPFRRAFSL